jgi:CDP-diacylglycerol---serine O-phosphatidyltransferase
MRRNKTREQDAMKKGIYILPNLFTTGNIFFGFFSIVAAINGQYAWAAVLIMIACVLDGLDGKIARFTGTTSRFGVEYDSLSDLVSFGMAPALLAYLWALSPFGRAGWIMAFFFVVCGALRLARFNVQSHALDGKTFVGLPIPAAAMMVASTVVFREFMGGTGMFVHPVIPLAMIALSLLMVSNIHYYSFKDLDFFARKPFMTFVSIVLVFVVIVTHPQVMLFSFALAYTLSGPSWTVFRAVAGRKKEPASEPEEKHGF